MFKNPFETFHNQWALVTAGNLEDYNTMTISWGGLGTLWSKPVATVYVKPIRHTYNYLESMTILQLVSTMMLIKKI